MKLEHVVSYATAVKALFDAHKDDVVNYNHLLDDPFEANQLDTKIAAVGSMLGTGVLRKLNKGETADRNSYMDKLIPILNDLEFKINICRTNGTITDSLASFGLSAFRAAIYKHEIDKFHLSYESTYARVGLVTTPLADVGFTAAKVTSIKGWHNKAWDLNTTKINLKLEINTLSRGNLAMVNDLLGVCQDVIDSIRAYAASEGDKKLMKQATRSAIEKSVVPTSAKKPRKRNIGPGSSVVLRKDMVAKNILQMTLLTDVKVLVCRQVLKTDACVTGSVLPFGTMVEMKKKEIMGSGEFVKLTNVDTNKKAVVLVYEVDVKKA